MTALAAETCRFVGAAGQADGRGAQPSSAAMSWIFGPEDPVFGGGACRVAECGRTARGRGLCQGHLQRWNDQGRPDLERFVAIDRSAVAAATTEPTVPGDRAAVTAPRAAVCVSLHAQRWERAGRPRSGRVAGRSADRSSSPPRARPAASRTARCGRRRRRRSAKPTPTPGRSTGVPTSTSSPTSFAEIDTGRAR